MKLYPLFLKLFLGLVLLISSCAAPKYIPENLEQLKTSEELGQASRHSYQLAQAAIEKNEKLKQAHAGITYAEKCLKKSLEEPLCLYYQVLNTGIYIKNHIP